ncbi:MAG: phosphoribosylformylglycinamidine synthase I [Actinomycetota bacterium]|nr:phosphoribosylformylglycinamidine synthase I [Actinomycetota bacterium]
MSKVKVLVLLAAGVNCDRETALAFELAGAVADRVHVNDIIERPRLPADYQILALPGGFSFGDDIASGQVLARKLKHRLAGPITDFVSQGKLVLGICNGFQVLVKLGLLPALGGDQARQQAALTFNTSAKFEDRWVYLKPDPAGKCVFTRGLKNVIYLPVRHGEGRFVIGDDGLAALKSAGQVALRYVDAAGSPGDYPINPNGSVDDIAGISDATGRVFGLMPHPEVFIRPTQHPRWTRGEGAPPDGIEIFKNAVEYFKGR